jgi:hypothetical protein
MLITRQRYENTKRKLAKVQALTEITDRWEQALSRHDDSTAARVDAIEVMKDGRVKFLFDFPNPSGQILEEPQDEDTVTDVVHKPRIAGGNGGA